jgi:phage I-like protein
MRGLVTLTQDFGLSELPTRVRLFSRGWNETSKGRFLFDGLAAKSVMQHFESEGVDLMFDLEHQSLDRPTQDPTSRDARAWATLAIDASGDLYAEHIRWTKDGQERLENKAQRYLSPAFNFDPATRRILSIVNVALVAMPATHHAAPLVAASKKESVMLNKQHVQDAMDAVAAGDMAALDAILLAMMEAVEEPEATSAVDNEMAAAGRQIVAMVGAKSATEALSELSRRSDIAVRFEAREAKLAAEQAQFDSVQRKQLVASLVLLGAETPATAWENDAAESPCARLLSEPLESLRARVTALSSASHQKKKVDAKPALYMLSERELAKCKEAKVDPEKYAAHRALLRRNQETV